ncbi:MAG: hypothetical protein WC810_27025 [Janthinobacterium sp.]|jgi:O-antigen ligase
MYKQIFNKRFGNLIAIFAGIEVISYLATFVPIVIIVAIAVFIIARKNLLLGLQIAIAELVIGSKGYLFALSIGGINISIRLAIFLSLILAWLIYYSAQSKFWKLIAKRVEIKLILAFIVMLVIGVINGLIHNYSLLNIFNDVNGYLYLGLLPVFYDAITSKDEHYKIIQILLAGSTFIALQTLFLAYVFFHNIEIANYFLYKWIRIAGLGEITKLSPDYFFYRIFLQSQIYIVIAISIVVPILRTAVKKTGLFYFLAACYAALIISSSRSLWLGIITALTVSTFLTILIEHNKFQAIIKSTKFLVLKIGYIIIGAALAFFVVNVPIPIPPNYDMFNFVGQRFTITNEAAVSTRWKELLPIMNVIKKSPVIGSGFGTLATFNSDDPRIKNIKNPSGEVSTFSFEWGYFDTITEIGLIGLFILLAFLASMVYDGYKKLIAESDETEKMLTFGLIIGLISLAVIHTFSPYLNHPLGLGYLMIVMVWVGLPEIIQISDRSNIDNR